MKFSKIEPFQFWLEITTTKKTHLYHKTEHFLNVNGGLYGIFENISLKML